MAKHISMTDTLRKALTEAIDGGVTFRAIERDTGVLRQSLMKFVRGETSLRLDMADKLADYFGLELKSRRPRKRK